MRTTARKRPIVIGTLAFVAATVMAAQTPKIALLRTRPKILYKNTANEIYLEGADGADLKASGAEVTKGKKKPKGFVVVPTAKVAKLRPVVTGALSRPLPTQQMQVVDPPLPIVHVLVNAKEYGRPIPIPKTSRITIRLTADPGFAAEHPDEALYHIEQVDVLAQQSLGPPTRVQSLDVSEYDPMAGIPNHMPTEVRQAPPGTMVYFHIKAIYRKSAAGLVEVAMPERYLYISFMIK